MEMKWYQVTHWKQAAVADALSGSGERKGDHCRQVRRVLPTTTMIHGRIRQGGEADGRIWIRQGGEAADEIQWGGGADHGIRRQRRRPGFNGEERSAAVRSEERVATSLAWRGAGARDRLEDQRCWDKALRAVRDEFVRDIFQDEVILLFSTLVLDTFFDVDT
jgi:hypothetical protein